MKSWKKFGIIINEMVADDGPVPMDPGNVAAHDARTTQSDQDASNDMSYEDVCAIAWKEYKKLAKKQARKDHSEHGRANVVKELMN